MTARRGLDPVTLSVLSSALSGIAEEMGTVLVRSAYSSNIKERRDCSAALFDADGRMVAQAEHIPVHLGAMPEAVAAVIDRAPEPGDVFVVNDPYSGGNHLPDVTMVSPLGTEDEPWGFAVTRSACFFALRVLLPDDIPANAGTYAPLAIVAPEGSLVNAHRPSAVVAGNVETSQRLADTVMAALAQVAELPAEGQGTMNNVNIGGRGWTYYETIGGGQGASAHGPGPSGVHVGMSNTLNTPIEAFELEYPMRVERFELAAGSGGSGTHRGGDGIVRSIRVLEPATLSLLTDRRRHPPQGRRGGSPGALGRNECNGEELPPKISRPLDAGDVITITTPGGGGYGPPPGPLP